MRRRRLHRHRTLLPFAAAVVLIAAGCGGDEQDAEQEALNTEAQAMFEQAGLPADTVDCLVENLEEEFPVERIEELAESAGSDPFSAFGPEEMQSMLEVAQGCGGAGALAPPPPAQGGGSGGSGAYFDCVAAAGSSAEVAKCERRHLR